jgi:Holliday junction resolvase RusA-like endonuclease
MLEFAIPIKPQGKARHRTRVVMIGRKPVAMQYSDPKGVKYEKAIRDAVIKQYKGEPLEGPLSVQIYARFERPKSVNREWHTVKPDADNVGKAVCDALNGVLWIDDRQIVTLAVFKQYASRGEIRIGVEQL